MATSKATVLAKEILEYFASGGLLHGDCGQQYDGSSASKDKVVLNCLDELNISHEGVVLVGDTIFDVVGARKVGIDCIAVLYGYGPVEVLQRENPTYLVETVEDLGRFFMA